MKLKSIIFIFIPLSIIFIFPVIFVVFYSFMQRGIYGGIEYVFTLENYKQIFNYLYIKIFVRTFLFASLNTILCTILSFPVAIFISKQNNTVKNIMLVLVVLPFWTNFIVRSYSWMIILRDEGIINSILLYLGFIDKPLQILFSPVSIIIGLVYGYLPLSILPIYSALEKININLIDAARDLGASSLQCYLKIILPLSKKGIITSIILVFIPSLGEFVIPDILGGSKIIVMGNLIKIQFIDSRNWPLGSVFAVFMVFCVFLMIIPYINGINEKIIIKRK